GWYRATHRWSTRDTNRCRRLGQLGTAAPQVVAALADGTIGVVQSRLIADAFANPRVADQVVDAAAQLIEHAQHLSAVEFEQVVRRFVLLVDHDGSARAAERALTDRKLSIGFSDHTFSLRVNGPAADGVALRAAWKAQLDLEWQADWDACVAEHGDQACPALLRRTVEQRGYDAFMTVAAGGVTAVVHLLADAATFEGGVAEVFDTEPATAARPDDIRRWASHTADGTFVPAVDIVLAAVRDRVRHVITDHRGIVLHMGRTRRLFTGRARDAVLLAATRCTHPGCDTVSGDSQADHLHPHAHGGTTSTTNGGPACGKHNRWRYTTHARTVLDERGYWHTYRNDGTEVA
ncbi:MAG: DUF222 domain-containing protein, partial [Ilumatobacteraceae bacterium]